MVLSRVKVELREDGSLATKTQSFWRRRWLALVMLGGIVGLMCCEIGFFWNVAGQQSSGKGYDFEISEGNVRVSCSMGTVPLSRVGMKSYGGRFSIARLNFGWELLLVRDSDSFLLVFPLFIPALAVALWIGVAEFRWSRRRLKSERKADKN
jgi:hypothetical protein